MSPHLRSLYARLSPRRFRVARPLAVLACAVLGALWAHDALGGADIVDAVAVVVVGMAWGYVAWCLSG